MPQEKAIHWFRQDLRLSDNPALYQAAQTATVLPIYILDDDNAAKYSMGSAGRVWLHSSLISLCQSLGQNLSLYRGDPLPILLTLCKRYQIKRIFWNRCYEPWRISRDTHIKEQLEDQGITVHSHNGSLLWEPWHIKKEDGTSYKVFTPFYRKGCLSATPPREPLPVPDKLNAQKDTQDSLKIDDLALLPKTGWDNKMRAHWDIGEHGAHQRLSEFLRTGMEHYKEGRNLPAKPYVSKLSPYLHFGEISPNQLYYAARQFADNEHVDHFCSELGWREFSYSQLYFNPSLPERNLQKKFDDFPWKDDQGKLSAWQKGKTGIPFVDAGMRELWQTGYMHNRVRMVVGSFLVKNLLLHWHHGERWFWDCLVDADLANNSASWQWVAGCGADAAPYFRIFNPVTQGEKFDPQGEYVRQYVPELKKLPDKYLFKPWEAPNRILKDADMVLGVDYPEPIIDLKTSRQAALSAFETLKGNLRHPS
jgi:deoxyribodipyrimidine photo-lyase